MSLTVTNATLDGDPAALRVEDGTIAALGPDVAAQPGDETLDAGGMALTPGLVNAHTHAAMTLFRGYADDLPLMRWLEDHIWPAEARLQDEDVYWGARLACVEMIRTGTVRFWDMYWHPAATARAVADAGLRAVIAGPALDGCDPSRSQGMLADVRRDLDRVAEVVASTGAADRIATAVAPHAIYTVSEPSLRGLAELAAGRGDPLQTHLSETEHEVGGCLDAHGVRPAEHLRRLGVLGPGTVLAHGVWLDEAELDLVAGAGATLVTNPVANLKLAVGRVFPYLAARERAIPAGIGTDGAGSNNSLDLLADVKTFALLQKNEAGDPSAVTAGESWELATGRRSSLLGGAALEVGAPADFLLARTDAPELSLGDLEAGLVYAASGAVVDTTVVAGKVLMRGGVVEGSEEVIARARERASALGLDRRRGGRSAAA